MIVERIDQDLKSAMLSGDKVRVAVYRGLKSALQYAGVDKGGDLDENEIISVLQKEAKKRLEAADLYKKSGNNERAEQELGEKSIIEQYLPAQASEEDVSRVIDEVVERIGEVTRQNMGQVIGQSKAKLGASADGSVIARLVQSRLK